MKQFRLSRLATRDLEEIADYIGARNPTAAVRQLDRLFEMFATLGTQPLLGQLRDDLPSRPRSFCPGNYVILYKPAAAGIHVVRVVHAARDLKSLLGRED
jgi:toxin ParE1/3/4